VPIVRTAGPPIEPRGRVEEGQFALAQDLRQRDAGADRDPRAAGLEPG
jgi:hypothetical protein